MTIAILYICTGKYHIFFDSFYKSCERYFLPNIEKTYFVFSDHDELQNYKKVFFTHKECEGFPLDSLFRFRTFLLRKNELLQYDYIYFFNSNIEFVDFIGKEIIPRKSDGHLCCLDADYDIHYPHPAFYPYERNKKSTAYIPRENRQYRYFHGAVNGGHAAEYIFMCETLEENISADLRNGIVARYHDESHLNRYFFSHNCLSLHGEYGTPEGSKSQNKAKIIIIDKTRYDNYFSKGRKSGLSRYLLRAKDLIVTILNWYR